MRRAIRQLLRIPAPSVSIEKAESVARAEAENRGWSWSEPISREETLRGYRFRTNADKRGSNVEVEVRADTGEITGMWFAPR
jgi:hypothetical protein